MRTMSGGKEWKVIREVDDLPQPIGAVGGYEIKHAARRGEDLCVSPVLFDFIEAQAKAPRVGVGFGSRIEVEPLYGGKNPQNLRLEAEVTGDPGIYQEIRVSAIDEHGTCVGDALVGLAAPEEDESAYRENGGIAIRGEMRVLVTVDGDGDGDHGVAVFPERAKAAGAVDAEWE